MYIQLLDIKIIKVIIQKLMKKQRQIIPQKQQKKPQQIVLQDYKIPALPKKIIKFKQNIKSSLFPKIFNLPKLQDFTYNPIVKEQESDNLKLIFYRQSKKFYIQKIIKIFNSTHTIFSKKNRYIEIQQSIQRSAQVLVHILDTHLCIVRSCRIQNYDIKQELKYTCRIKQLKHLGPQSQTIEICRTKDKNHIYINNYQISKTHCKIYKVLDDLNPLSKAFITFLYCIQNIENYHPLSKLPKNIIKIILKYARNINGYFITDVGSLHGTYIQIGQKYSQIKQKYIYSLAGSRYALEIRKIHKHQTNQLTRAQSNHKMLQMLKNIEYSNQSVIILQNPERNYEQNIKISILEMVIKLQNKFWQYFVVSTQPHIRIGLNHDIHLDYPQIIDVQSQILFQRDKWWIKDGVGTYPSTFGTWRKILQDQQCILGLQDTIKLGSQVILQFKQLKGYKDQFK